MVSRISHFMVLGLALSAGLAACSGSGGRIDGVVWKGPVSGATVSLYAVEHGGQRGERLGMTLSAADGSYTLLHHHQGPVEIVATGGQYVDEATGATVQIPDDQELRAYLEDCHGDHHVTVSAMTTVSASHAHYLMGAPSQDAAGAIAAAEEAAAVEFGLPAVDLTDTTPHDLTDGVTHQMDTFDHGHAYAAALAAMSQYAESVGAPPEHVLTLIHDLSEDFHDGVVDGMVDGHPLVPTSELSTVDCVGDQQVHEAAFIASPENTSGYTETDLMDYDMNAGPMHGTTDPTATDGGMHTGGY